MIIKWILEGIFMGLALWGAIEDLKYRAVSLWVLILLSVVSVGLFFVTFLEVWLWRILSIALVSLLMLALVLFKKAGWADLVMMMGMFTGFSFGQCFWTCILSLIMVIVFVCIKKVKKEGVPFFSVLGFSCILAYVGNVIWTIVTANGF